MNGNRNLIPISALVTFGTITLASLQEEDRLPGTDQWLGFVIAYFVIAALGDLGVPLAGGLAVLTMVAVLLERGGAALGYAQRQTSRAQKNQPRPGGSAHDPGHNARGPAPPAAGHPMGAPGTLAGLPLHLIEPTQPLSPSEEDF